MGRYLKRPATAFGAALVVAFVGLYALGSFENPTEDAFIYDAMARFRGSLFELDPFQYRVGTPWLAAWLPGGTQAGFMVVQGAMWTVAGGFLWWWLTDLDLPAWPGLAAWGFAPVVVSTLASPYQPDPSIYAAVAIVFWALGRRLWWVLPLVVAVGGFSHEITALLAIPIAVTALLDRAWWKAVPSVVTAVGVYVVLRHTPLLYGEVVEPDRFFLDWDHWQTVIEWRAASDGSVLGAVWTAFVTSLGPLWVLAALGWRHASRELRWVGGSWIATCACLWPLGTDWYRFLGYAFVPVVALTVLSLRPLSRTGLEADERRVSE